jgi:hypothetical protein
MATLEVKKPNIPLWTGANGSLVLNVNADPSGPLSVGANPILDASFNVDGNQSIAFARSGSVAIGVQAGAHARIVPIFQESVGSGADLVKRFSLADFLKPNNLLLAFELGGDANLTAQGAFTYSVLSATAILKAGVDATYVTIRSFPRTTTIQAMLPDLMGNLTLPACITQPPAPGDLVSFEYGGVLNFNVGASAGYEIKGTNSLKISEILLSEHYALSVIGKLSFTGQLAGRFSVDVTAGSEPGFARVVVRRRRQKELQFAADVSVRADLKTDGLPASGKEFLGALLGVQGKNWLNLVDGLVTEAGQVDSIENLKAKLDGLALDYLGAFAGKAIDQITAVPEVKAFQERLAKVVASYRELDQRAIALFDRYFDPVLNRINELTAKLDELNALVSFDQLKGEIDPILWNVLRQLTDGDPLGWALGFIPGTNTPSLPELKKRVQGVLSLVKDDAHDEIRKFIAIAKEQFKLDALFDQLALVSSPDALKTFANQKLGHFVERLIGDALDQLNGKGLKKAFNIVQDVVKARDTFFRTFDNTLKEAAAQSFTLDLHAAYNSASESQALIDMEVKLQEPDGSSNSTGLRFMEAAGRGDFQEVLANFQPSIVKLREGLLTHKVTTGTSLLFNISGWHHSFHYEAMHQVIVQTQQQIRNSGPGVLTVFTNIDMTADTQRRRRGTKSEEAVLTNFLLRFLAETKVSDSNFDKKSQLYVLDVITGMSAQYSVTFTDSDTSSAELDDYLQFAIQLGLDKVGATREGLLPVLEFKNHSFGKIESDYEVRYTETGLKRLINMRPSDAEIKKILRRIVLANYFNHPTLHDVGWLYSSDDVRKLFDENGNNFINAESILGGAPVTLSSPIPGILPPGSCSSNFLIRNDVAILFRIEDEILKAFGELMNLLASSGTIKTSELESRLKSFGEALNAFDEFDMGENSVFAAFDGLILTATDAAQARSSSLRFKSSKDGAEHTKVFTLRAAALAGIAAGRS